MPTVDFVEKCKSCGGTGLYAGMAEQHGAAVVCSTCKGTGAHRFHYEYEKFTVRADRPGIRRVYEVNPGVCIGEKKGVCTLEDFGGQPYLAWRNGTPFPAGSENRKYTCPAWWYQSANYEKKPEWEECEWGCTFSRCRHFSAKDKCWERWDREQK